MLEAEALLRCSPMLQNVVLFWLSRHLVMSLFHIFLNMSYGKLSIAIHGHFGNMVSSSSITTTDLKPRDRPRKGAGASKVQPHSVLS